MIIRIFLSLFVLSAVTGFAVPVGDEIKTECGGRARVVWCQDAGEGSDPGAAGNNLRLMGFDTDDGQGERRILANLSNYAKPMLTPDGRGIVFSNRPEQKIYIVGFDGSDLKPLANGFALAVWRDSLTETDWVYAGTVINNEDSVIVNIRRFRLDKPEISEPVWSKTPLNIDNFQLSANGRYASGLFPWPSCGVAVLPDGEWKKFGDGCWPSLSPDGNLLLWIFDGAHRNLTFFRTKTDERWVVNINHAPGIDGFEVYHPRWSNHPLFMVMTGPYKLGEGNNRIRGGGKEVEIYLGKFSKDFRKIEKWIRITRNQQADFFPDLWLAVRCERVATPAEGGLRENKKASAAAWPVSFDKLVFFWQNRSKANTFTDPVTQVSHVCRAEAKGRARYGRHFEMAPSGGAFIADSGAGELLDACTASRQLGLEVLITPADGNFNLAEYGDGTTTSRLCGVVKCRYGAPTAGEDCAAAQPGVPGRSWAGRPSPAKTGGLRPIIGYAAQSGIWNFLLAQKNDHLVFQLRSAQGGPDYLLDLGAIDPAKPSHVIVSCSSAGVVSYLNGEQVFSADSVYGGNWQAGKIVFGNELLPDYAVEPDGTSAGWQGMIENAAIYSRWIGPEEARKKYNASVAAIAGRKPLPVLSVAAKLISAPVVPAPESIAPYRRAIAVGQYLIEQVAEGTCSNREIMVARWVILDGRALSSAQRQKGKEYRLKLEQFSDHPELEGERMIMDSDRFDLPLYYDVSDY